MLRRLELHGLEERAVAREGNCQFEALAVSLYDDATRADEVRDRVTQRLATHQERYSGDAGSSVAVAACLDGLLDGGWGCRISLMAAADEFNATITIVHGDADLADRFFFKPTREPAARTIHLAFADQHYSATRLARGLSDEGTGATTDIWVTRAGTRWRVARVPTVIVSRQADYAHPATLAEDALSALNAHSGGVLGHVPITAVGVVCARRRQDGGKHYVAAVALGETDATNANLRWSARYGARPSRRGGAWATRSTPPTGTATPKQR